MIIAGKPSSQWVNQENYRHEKKNNDKWGKISRFFSMNLVGLLKMISRKIIILN